MATKQGQEKVAAIVTQRIIDALEKGVIPWHKPWKTGFPCNLQTKKPYRGVNLFTLVLAGGQYKCRYWVTEKQAKAMGGRILDSEKKKGTPVVFSKPFCWETKDDNGNVELHYRKGFNRFYTVYNVEQTTGLIDRIPEEKTLDFQLLQACENIINGMPKRPEVRHGGHRACYVPGIDVVNMPEKETFETVAAYYSTLFHEIGHSTGHLSRLNRKTLTDLCPFGSTNYSREELTAETVAAILCGMAGIDNETVDNSASYIQSWLNRLQNDRGMLVDAMKDAQRAVDYILKAFENK